MTLSPSNAMRWLATLLLLLASPSFLAHAQSVSVPGDEGWVAVGTDLTTSVRAMALRGDEVMLAGGLSVGSGEMAVGRWSGGSFGALERMMGAGSDTRVDALMVDGPNLYVGGFFNATSGNGGMAVRNLTFWNGSAWSTLNGGPGGPVLAMVVHEGNLIAGGSFAVAGGVPANNIARWNGAEWSALGSGVDSTVQSLAVYDGKLYAGGLFRSADGTVNHIARWNGSAWEPVGGGMNPGASVSALLAFDGKLYAGGLFTSAGGEAVSNIAMWDGEGWHDVGGGVNNRVRALAANDRLYAGGNFTKAGGGDASYVAMWDGERWSAMGSGVNSEVRALVARSEDVLVGGLFTYAGGKESRYFARWVVPVASVGGESAASHVALSVAPNPAEGAVEVRLQMRRAGRVRIDLLNALGQSVATLAEGEFAEGTRTIRLDLSAYPAGLYRCRLDAGGSISTTPLLLSR